MTLAARVTALAQAIGADIKSTLAKFTFVRSETGAVSRDMLVRLREFDATSTDFAIPTDGTTSAVSAIGTALASGVTTIEFLAGNYLISANTTITADVVMRAWAVFVVPTGVTLTITGNFSGSFSKHFQCTGTGRVILNPAKVTTGYPEWWGATVNAGADCTAAISACILACPVTQLQSADYYVSTLLQINTSGRTLVGQGCEYYGVAGQSTRLISLSGSSHILVVGPSSAPASINDFPRGIIVRDLQVTRSVAPVIASAPIGVLSRWTLYEQLVNVKSAESIYGFYYQGTVQVRSDSCQAFRSIAGSGTGNDNFRGFFIDGSTVLSGVAGGNASTHWLRCVSGCVVSGITVSYGMYINGSWADTFIDTFEASVCSVGIYLQGDTTSTLNYRTVDLHIINPIIDQFSFAGIWVDGTSSFAAVSIQGGYAAPVSTGTPTACVYVLNSFGLVNLSGGFQAICGPNTSMTGGIVGVGSRNFDSIGNSVSECSQRGIILTNCNFCRTEDRVTNHGRTGVAGVSLQGTSSRNSVRGFVNGAASSLTYGIELQGASTQYNSIDPTGVNAGVVTGAKLQINGAAVTTVGTANNNYVYGVAA